MIKKSHVYSSTGTWKKGRLNQTFNAIIWPNGVKTYITLTMKGKCSEDYDIFRLAHNHLDYQSEIFGALLFPNSAKCDKLTLTFTMTEGKN